MRRCGAIHLDDGSVKWRVWAPRASGAELVLIDGERRSVTPMKPEEEGYFGCVLRDIAEDQRYAFKFDGGAERQDPCSLWQPEGVPGPSAVVRPSSFEWGDSGWKGVARGDLAIYELHVGTFTREGTFEAAIPRLRTLKELGISAVEIMPVAQFPGDRNWGYDGVLPYAAQNTYGGPRGLQKLVDAAHSEGLAVILDVVYNHLGPEANFVHELGPYFTDKYKTPWGQAVNYDDRGCDAVRDWVLDSAEMWLEEFHLDGLRLDAVHAIYDLGARHILRAIEEVAESVASRTGRQVHVIAESDLNDPRIIVDPERGGYGLAAQWSDDFHHAVHAFLTKERRGYYSDFGGADQVAEVLRSPFLYAWHHSVHRGRKHGAPLPPELTGDRFVVCIQNHDQVGNRAKGDRLSTLLETPAKLRLAASLLLFSPHLPLLFMGEEYGETNPFPFFCSFAGTELVEAVRKGRKGEFADFLSDADQIPDPDARETFESAKLSWSWPEGSGRAGLRLLYRDLLHARRDWPALRDFTNRDARLLDPSSEHPVVILERGSGQNRIDILLNLSDARVELAQAPGERLLFSSESARYLGNRSEDEAVRTLLPWECLVSTRR